MIRLTYKKNKNRRIRKRVILLGLSLSLIVNHVLLWQRNQAYAINSSLYEPTIISTQPYNNSTVNKSTIIQNENIPQVNVNYNSNSAYTPNPKNQYLRYNPNRPEWSEFCPYGLETAQKDDSFHLWATNARYKADNQNYWVERRKDFEKDVAFCDKVQPEYQNACYQKVRIRQLRINSNYIDPWQKAEIRRRQFQEAYNMQLWYDATKNKNINVHHSGNINNNMNLNINGIYRHQFYNY